MGGLNIITVKTGQLQTQFPEAALAQLGHSRRGAWLWLDVTLVAGTGAKGTPSGTGISSPLFPVCPPCAGPSFLPHPLNPQRNCQGSHEHPHVTDSTVKAWRQRESLVRTNTWIRTQPIWLQVCSLGHGSWTQARAVGICVPSGKKRLGGPQGPGENLFCPTHCPWGTYSTASGPPPLLRQGGPFYRQRN